MVYTKHSMVKERKSKAKVTATPPQATPPLLQEEVLSDLAPCELEPGELELEPGELEPGELEPGELAPCDLAPCDLAPCDLAPCDLEPGEAHDEGESKDDDETTVPTAAAVKIPKKRGRKPKGGKIIITNELPVLAALPEPNIILHLKCGAEDLTESSFPSITECSSGIDNFQFEGHHLHYQELPSLTPACKLKLAEDDDDSSLAELDGNEDRRALWKKVRELTYNLHTNNIADKKSACFWCTCDFDNPPIFLPKHEISGTYYCYGCFCSPECATAFLLKEPIDSSSRFERYHLLNHIYCKIYDYKKNIKPAPDPYYTLNKYYGNLSIQEYRRLLKSERLLLVVDKPLSRTLPELHEDNDDFMSSGNTIPPASKFKLRRKAKQTKTDIISETFNFEGNSK